jgi:uncharacterized membrane protein YqaE (UPF0057 family)
MKFFLVLGSIALPLIMIGLQRRVERMDMIFNLLSIICALTFGNISAFAIYDIIHNHTVFMTNIHALFLNPLFLLTGAYLGVYLLYRLIFWTITNLK